MAAKNLLALDIGEKRIGVARGNLGVHIAEPLATIVNDGLFFNKLQNLINEHQIDILVVGLPRNLGGLETSQTKYVRDFCQQYLGKYDLPIVMQDETLSTKVAQDYLDSNKKSNISLDSIAAAIILEDYFKELQQ